jgi:hypothetical protein
VPESVVGGERHSVVCRPRSREARAAADSDSHADFGANSRKSPHATSGSTLWSPGWRLNSFFYMYLTNEASGSSIVM